MDERRIFGLRCRCTATRHREPQRLSRIALNIGKLAGPCINRQSSDWALCGVRAKAQSQLHLDFLPFAVRTLGDGAQDGEATFQMRDRFTIGQTCRGMLTRLQPLVDGALRITGGG